MGFDIVNNQTNEQFMNFNDNINNANNQEMNNNIINYHDNFSYPSNNEQFVQPKVNSNNPFYTASNTGISDNKKVLIIRSLILLYGMEKGIKTALINGVYDLRPYYLVNKTFIDKFKEKFQFNMINNISALSIYSKFSDFEQNIKSLEALNDVKNISKLIQGDPSSLSHIQLYPTLNSYGEYKFPTNFTIIHEEILNMLKHLCNVEYDVNDYRFQYKITFGDSTLYLQWLSNTNRIFAYPHNNNSFRLFCVFELFDNIFKNIFDRYLQATPLNQYLQQKNIKLNIKNKKQPLCSSGSKHLGDITIINQMSKIVNQNMPYNNNIINNNYEHNNIIDRNYKTNAFNIKQSTKRQALTSNRSNYTQELESEISELKEKLNKANITIEKQNKEIQELKTQLNSFKDKYISQINDLINEAKEKDIKINQLNQQLKNINYQNNNNEEKIKLENDKVVNFISPEQNLYLAIGCNGNSTFAEIEEKLYREYPKFRETNNTFLSYGSPILRFKTINENKIGEGKPIIMVRPS
jgi:hypothetical protein